MDHNIRCNSVFIKPHKHKDFPYLTNFIINNSITIIHFSPSMLNAFTQYLFTNNITLKSAKHIFCCGELLNSEDIKEKLFPNARIYNLYGPTEATLNITSKLLIDIIKGNISIGKPISNTKVYVLSECLSPLPIGAIGELYIGGAGLARGYLNQPGLTKEKFIPNPFATRQEKQENKNSRLYKTGDLVRWLPSGELEYIGRMISKLKLGALGLS